MREAAQKEKHLVVDILSRSFDSNRSVNYLIPQGSDRETRLRRLMEYSYDYCKLFGKVIISDDSKACALLVMPEKERTNLRSIILSIRLIAKTIGLSNLRKAVRRETAIKKLQPDPGREYLWFIGVAPEHQGEGIGSELLNSIVAEADSQRKPIYLETSVEGNLPFYQKFGFNTYAELDFGYKLFCLKRSSQ